MVTEGSVYIQIEKDAIVSNQDIVEIEIKEAVVIQKYLPEMASEEDIRAAVKTKMSELNADIKQMGAVIGAVKSKFGTSADGAVIAKIVKEELNK